MKRIVLVFFALLSLAACNKAQSELQPGPQEQETLGCPYTNVTLTYLGDDIGEQTSDAYLIKLWSDMQSDEFGNLQGPGELVQILLNAYYNPAQELNYSFLKGKYSPMSNSGSFTPYSFVPGYQTSIPAPGGRLTVYDGSYYGSLEKNSSEIEYDLLDEGDFEIVKGDNDTLIIRGYLAGNKFKKRYIDWKGVPEMKDEAPEEIPSSTLSRDIYEMAYRASEDDVMFVFKGESESVFQLGLKSPFVGMMNNVEDIYHNDDYLFYFEDKEYLFTQYHALKSGSIYVSKLDGEDNWDIKLDLILPEGSSFAFSYQGRIRNSE